MLLDLLQLADSAFPIGAFAHSWGLEGAVQEGLFGLDQGASQEEQEQALEHLLRARIALELARTDLPLGLAAHAAGEAGELATLIELDWLADAVRGVREWREASIRTGRRLLTTVCQFAPNPLIQELLATGEGLLPGPHLPVAFGLAAQSLGCEAVAGATGYAASAVMGQLAAAVRLGLIGQRGMQRTYHRLKPALVAALETARTVAHADIGGTMPLLEIAGMRHETAEERLFAS